EDDAAGRVAEGELDGLCVLVERVVDERHAEGLRRLAGCERERAARGRVVLACVGRAVGGRVVNGGRGGASERARDDHGGRARLFGGVETRGRKLHGAGRARLVADGELGGVAARVRSRRGDYLADGGGREGCVEGRVAVGIGRRARRADEGLALAVARRVALRVRVEVNRERRVGLAVE